MKRFLCLLLICLLIVPVALSDGIDLSAMTFDELRELQTQLAQEIVSRPEWKEVEVPAGNWRIGVDIPAGSYCIKSNDSSTLVQVWKHAVDDYSDHGCVYNEIISYSKPIGKIELEDGWLFTANDPVVFSPVRPLGF